MKRALAAFAASMMAVALSTHAHADQTQPDAVVELFTSQGCNSCPPADAALEKLVDEGNTLALAFHVDYWDYIGWKDTLASPENTQRQYGYARSMRRNSVYTPQAVVNGRAELNGGNLSGIKQTAASLRKSGQGLTVPVSATMDGGEIDVSVGAGAGKADIIIAYFNRQKSVEISRGENAGKTISYWNSVTKLSTIGMWDGEATLVKLPISVLEGGKFDGCAILLQSYGPDGEPGPILGATAVSYQHG